MKSLLARIANSCTPTPDGAEFADHIERALGIVYPAEGNVFRFKDALWIVTNDGGVIEGANTSRFNIMTDRRFMNVYRGVDATAVRYFWNRPLTSYSVTPYGLLVSYDGEIVESLSIRTFHDVDRDQKIKCFKGDAVFGSNTDKMTKRIFDLIAERYIGAEVVAFGDKPLFTDPGIMLDLAMELSRPD